MKTHLITLLSLILLITTSYRASSQEDLKMRGIEAGIDFLRFHNNFNPFGFTFHREGGREFDLVVGPAVFIRAPFGRNALRLKYEISQTREKYSTNSFDFSEDIYGVYTRNAVTLGIERYFVNRRFKLYGSADIGFAFIGFRGLYSAFREASMDYILDDPQDIKVFGVSVNPGIGIRYELFRNVNVILESSVAVEESMVQNDPYRLYQNMRLIARPVSLFGISYYFPFGK